MRKQTVWLLTLLLVATLALAACPAPAATPAAEAPAAAVEAPAAVEGPAAVEAPVAEAVATEAPMAEAPMGDMAMDWESVDPSGQTVVFWHQHTRERETALNEIVADFNATNEYGITVEAGYQGSYTDVFNKMLAVMNTNDVPNLVVAYQNQAATYQLGDSLVDMNGLVNSPKWGLTADEQADFFPSFFGSDVFPIFGGQRLGLAPNRSMEMLYYNMDWLAELGYDAPPTTPAEFKEMACKATEQPFSKRVGDISMGYELSTDTSRFVSFTFAFGDDIFDYATEQFALNSPGAVEAMTFLQEMFAEGCATLVAEAYGDQTDFGNGALLFTIGSSSGLPFYQGVVDEGAQFDWSVTAIPHTTADPVMNVYGASASIPKTTPEAELAAWLFTKYYTSPDIQTKWGLASNYFPVRQSAVNSEGIQAAFVANPAYKTAFDLLKYGKTEPPVPGYDFVRLEIVSAMAAIVDGADVQSTLDELNVVANEILADQMADIK